MCFHTCEQIFSVFIKQRILFGSVGVGADVHSRKTGWLWLNTNKQRKANNNHVINGSQKSRIFWCDAMRSTVCQSKGSKHLRGSLLRWSHLKGRRPRNVDMKTKRRWLWCLGGPGMMGDRVQDWTGNQKKLSEDSNVLLQALKLDSSFFKHQKRSWCSSGFCTFDATASIRSCCQATLLRRWYSALSMKPDEL